MDVNQELIDELELEREELLKRFPHLRMLQTEIEIVKAEAGVDHLERAMAISNLIVEIINRDLMPALQDLHNIFEKVLSKDDKK